MSSLKTTLWEHQQRAVDFAKDKTGAMLAMDMGTGKSLTTLALIDRWEPERILILAPLSVLGVWRREFERHLPGAYRVLVLDSGDTKKKARQLADACAINKPLAVVTNYESAWREALKERIFSTPFDLIVFDESHRVKAPGGKASWFAKELSKRVPRRLALTGTPMPHSPLDLYAQYRALDTSIFGTSYNRFKLRYAEMGGYQGKQVTGFTRQDEMQAKFRQIAFQVTKEEALDLPEQVHVSLTCRLCPTAQAHYKSMERNFYIELERGEVTAGNALVKLLRLQQMTSGYLTDDDGVEHAVDESKENLLREVLSDIPRKQPVVVFTRFRRDLDTVRRVAHEQRRVYGEVSGRAKALTEHGCFKPDIDLMGVQIQSGGVGIDLTRASVAIYFSMGFSLGDYMQSLSRLHRPGQEHKVTYYHLIAEGTVDEKVYVALQNRQNVVNEILGGNYGSDEELNRSDKAETAA